MGSQTTKVQAKPQDKIGFNLEVIPSKAVFGINEDITGDIIIDMSKTLNRQGLIVVSLDGKE